MENSNFSGVIKILLFFFICTLFTINSVSQELPIISYGTKEGLPSVFINSLTQDNYGRIWVSHHTGVSVYNGSRFQSWSREDGLLASAPNMIVSDNKGSIWISFSSRGIQYMEMDGTIHTVPDPYEVFSKDRIPFLYRMNDKTILGAGKKGFYRISKKRIQGPFYPEDGKEGRAIYILDLGKKKGKLISTEDGVYRAQGNSVSRFPLPYEKIGSQIISLMTEGIKVFDMVKVKEGEFWLGCSSGIGKFDGKEYEFFGFHDGVAVEESNTNAILCDQKGRVWIGGKNITLVYPFLIQKPSPPKPLIIKVVAGKRVYTLPESIELSPKIRTIEIFFSSPSYFNEQGQVFRYRLRNIEKEWSETKEEHSVRYANLPPGDLIYEVQSRQRHGDWSGSISRLGIKMLPTFWQTGWAKAIIVLILVTLGFIISFVWVMYLKSQKIKLQKLVKKQTRKIRSQRDMLTKLASVDELTQLANRRKFFETMEIDMLKARRYNRPLSLCIFDIDDFKDINDRCGHYAGDKVLKFVAERGTESIRVTDLLGRWGGDEFILLMPETNKSRAIKICQRLKNNIESSPVILSDEATITFTITGGISTWDPDKTEYKKSEDFFKEADIALYQGKESGKNTISVYENHQKKEA